jgi:hypothetical protein
LPASFMLDAVDSSDVDETDQLVGFGAEKHQ